MVVVLLPGMDGTGSLFGPFISALPAGAKAVVVRYPVDAVLTYEQLADRVIDELPRDEPYILVAESFSGPVALRVAARGIGSLRATVLVASFVTPPFGRLGCFVAHLPIWELLFRLRPPRWMIRRLLLDSDALVEAVREAISKVRPGVMASRVRLALATDSTEILQRCPMPVFLLCGQRDRLLGRRTEGVQIAAPHLVLQCAPTAAVRILDALQYFK